MAKINRFLTKIFAKNPTIATGVFGSENAGGTSYEVSENPETIQSNDAWEGGWGAASNNGLRQPALQDFQAISKVETTAQKYIFQEGVPEYLSTETYYINSFCKYNNKLYYSLTDDNTGNNPESDNVNWKLFLREQDFIQKWLSTETYKINQIVYVLEIDGSISYYISLTNNNTGNNPKEDATNWKKTTGVSITENDLFYREDFIYGFKVDNGSVELSTPELGIEYTDDNVGFKAMNVCYSNSNFHIIHELDAWCTDGDWGKTYFYNEYFKGCVIGENDDEPKYFLSRTDYTKKEDGTDAVITGGDGDLFTQIKNFYMYIEEVPHTNDSYSDLIVKFSNKKQGKGWYSINERRDNKGFYYEADYTYYGMDRAGVTNNIIYCCSGKDTRNTTLNQYMVYCQNKQALVGKKQITKNLYCWVNPNDATDFIFTTTTDASQYNNDNNNYITIYTREIVNSERFYYLRDKDALYNVEESKITYNNIDYERYEAGDYTETYEDYKHFYSGSTFRYRFMLNWLMMLFGKSKGLRWRFGRGVIGGSSMSTNFLVHGWDSYGYHSFNNGIWGTNRFVKFLHIYNLWGECNIFEPTVIWNKDYGGTFDLATSQKIVEPLYMNPYTWNAAKGTANNIINYNVEDCPFYYNIDTWDCSNMPSNYQSGTEIYGVVRQRAVHSNGICFPKSMRNNNFSTSDEVEDFYLSQGSFGTYNVGNKSSFKSWFFGAGGSFSDAAYAGCLKLSANALALAYANNGFRLCRY